MSIIEFIIGILILVASLLAKYILLLCEERKERCECGDWRERVISWHTRRNKDNGKLNKVVVVSASVIAVLILALTVYGARF